MGEVKIRSAGAHGRTDGTICIQTNLHGLCLTHTHTQTEGRMTSLVWCRSLLCVYCVTADCALQFWERVSHEVLSLQTNTSTTSTYCPPQDLNTRSNLSSCCGSQFSNVYSPDSGKLLTENLNSPPVTMETEKKKKNNNRTLLNNAVCAAIAPYRESSLSWQELLLVWEVEQMSRNASIIQKTQKRWLTAKHRLNIWSNFAAAAVFCSKYDNIIGICLKKKKKLI